MGNCKIRYNVNGLINSVLDKQGNESILFNQIANLPFINNKNEALSVYKQTLSKDFSLSNDKYPTKELLNNKEWVNQVDEVYKTLNIEQYGNKEDYRQHVADITVGNKPNQHGEYHTDSKIINIVYRAENEGTASDKLKEVRRITRELVSPELKQTGIFFAENKDYAEEFGSNVNSVILNSKKTKTIKDIHSAKISEEIESKEKDVDLFIGNDIDTEEQVHVIVDEKQAHILGSIKDIESFTNKSTITFKSGKNIFTTYKEALSTGLDIEAGIDHIDGFKSLIKVPNILDNSTPEGLVNFLIRGNIISDTKVEYDGNNFFVAVGDNYVEKQVNEDIAGGSLKEGLGTNNYTIKDGHISININNETFKLDSNHKVIVESLSKEILDTTKNNIKSATRPKRVDESDLKLKLLGILNKLGVETLSISDYLTKYENKNGVPPSVNALADIANRVVAFKDGLITLEDLTEETMHFIVEALPSETTANLLRNIHKSNEYAEFAESYRSLYSKNNPGKNKDEVEAMVRREVLGKIMKNSTLKDLNVDNSQRNFLQKALDFIKQFFNNVVGNNSYRKELSEINRIVDELFIQNNLDPSNIKDVDFVLYSIDDQSSNDQGLNLLRSINKQLLNNLKQSYNSIRRGGGSLYSDKVKLAQYEDRIDEVSQAAVAADFLALIQRQVSYVNNAINVAQSEEKPLSIESKNVLINLKSGVRNLLEQQRKITDTKTPQQLGLEKNSQKDILLKKLDETILSISDVSGKFNNLDNDNYNKIVDRIMQRHNLPESYRQFAESQAQMMKNEVGFFMETFGQLTHSSDALLNMTAQVIEEMWGKHAAQVQKRFRSFTKVMEDNGVDAKELTKLFDNGYLLSKYDFKAFDEKLNTVDLELYNKTFGDGLTLEKFVNLKSKGGLKSYSAAQQLEVNRKRQDKLSEFVERRMNDNYYKEQAKKYKNISSDTIKFLKGLSIERAILQNSVLDEKGRPIYTEFEKEKLDSLSQARKDSKSLVNSLGVLKTGIVQQTTEEADLDSRHIEKGGLIYSLSKDASIEAKISFELHLIDQDFQATEKDKNIDDFIEKAFEISQDSVQEAVEFVKNNLGVTFSAKYWDATLSNANIIDNEEVNSLSSNKDYIKQIREKRNTLSQLKRLRQDHKNPIEILGDQMNASEQLAIKRLVEEIDIRTQKLVVPDTVERNAEFIAESGTNRAYDNGLKLSSVQKGTQQEFEFIKKHVTEKNSTYLRSLENDAKNLDKDNHGNISQRTIDRLEENREDGESYYDAFLKMARNRILPYYKRFTPPGYTTIDELLDQPGTDEAKLGRVVQYITEIATDDNYDFNVHHTFRQTENIAVNSNFDIDFKGGFHQPRLDKFTNKKYIDTFAPDANGNATKNKGLFKTLEALEELQEANLDDIGLSGTHNLYLLPQISRTRANQVVDALSKGNKGRTLQEILKDTFNYRIDDLEYGAEENGADITKATDTKIVPTFYTKKLESEDDVTEDLFYSYLAMTNQSILNKLRKEGLSDVIALEDKMIQRVSPDGKAIQSTRNYKMMKSAIDFNYFGRKETRKFKAKLPFIDKEVDFTKILRKLNGYVKFRNLGLNVIVPFTSAITGEVNLQIERKIGEYISSDALTLASKEFRNLAPEAANTKNSLAYNDKSKLNVLGEFLQVYQMSNKAANAKYPTLMRWIPKIGMVLHQMYNFPIIPRIFLSILYDNRVVNGKIITKRDFIRANQSSDNILSKKELDLEWKKYEGEAIYNYLDVSETGVEFKPELLKKLDGDAEYLENKMQRIRSLVKDQVQKIDGQIPESQRVQAQRDAVFNYFMTHRGWLSISAQRRLKSAQYNLETGQLEEGSYITMKNLLFDMFGNIGTSEDKTWNLLKAWNKAKKGKGRLAESLGIDPSKEMTVLERDLINRNIKRVGIEFAFMTGIIALVALVSALADDEDNEDIYSLQLTNYFLYRLANETSSTQFGIAGQFSEVIKSPFVGYQQVLDVFSISNAFDTDEIKQGTYKGHTGTYKYFFKSTPGLKGLHDLMNIRNTSDTYRYYQEQSINHGSLGVFNLLNSED
jgi:transcriptional regulator with XRE-family HTH domain